MLRIRGISPKTRRCLGVVFKWQQSCFFKSSQSGAQMGKHWGMGNPPGTSMALGLGKPVLRSCTTRREGLLHSLSSGSWRAESALNQNSVPQLQWGLGRWAVWGLRSSLLCCPPASRLLACRVPPGCLDLNPAPSSAPNPGVHSPSLKVSISWCWELEGGRRTEDVTLIPLPPLLRGWR